MGTDPLEAMASQLETSGRYRVLRKIAERKAFTVPDGTPVKVGVVLDIETTGLDAKRDEIIELGMVKFEFSADGRIFRILGAFESFREPSIPIPSDISSLTGISPEMVRGASINPQAVEDFVADASIIIAHNAAFDRKFCERAWPLFTMKAWACSMSEIAWKTEGFEGTKLEYLLVDCGLYHEGHRASEDCRAVLEILAKPLPRSAEIALKALLDTARQVTIRIWAEGALYDLKDALRRKGYRWSDGSEGGLRAWWIDVPEAAAEAELKFLRNEIFQREVDIPTKRLTAFDRFSERT